MATPLLLMRPEGSRDRAGVVTPFVEPTTTVSAGQYGQQWVFADTSAYVAIFNGDIYLSPLGGTIALRWTPTDATLSVGFNRSGLNGIALALSSLYASAYMLDVSMLASTTSPLNVPMTMLVTYTSTLATLTVDGVTVAGPTAIDTSGLSTPYITIGASPAQVESVLIYDVPLTPGQIAALSQPNAWTWDMLDDGPVPGLLLPV